MTWALVFLTNPLCNLLNKNLDSAKKEKKKVQIQRGQYARR
jgi:hypothetical protein